MEMIQLTRHIYFLFFLLTPIYIFSQSSASASFGASVNIIKPIEIQTTANMNFADIEAKGPGTVILNPDNSRIANGDIQLRTGSNVSAAEFKIQGENNFAYSVTLPSGEYYMTNGEDRITISDFTLGDTNFEIANNNSSVRIGATLSLDRKPEPGTYITTTPIEVIVSYN